MSALVAPARGQRAAPGSVFGTLSSKTLAASGFAMLAFVLLHLGGNLLAFGGSATFNAYARSIRELGAPLLGEGGLLLFARVVLAGTLVLHLIAHAYRLWRPNDTPEPSRTVALPPWYATLPASVLQASGGVIALFLAFHIAQLTIGATHPGFVANDPYHNMVVALRFWPTSIAYIVVAVAVGLHLLPGLWTGMRSLGLIRPATERLAGTLSPVMTLVLAVGLASVPVGVLIGAVR
jgi:succinate dehydrogenase / fumarate reductase, cytochrome b subunit